MAGTVSLEDMKSYLRGLTIDALAQIIVDQARADDGFYRKLSLRTNRERRGGPDMAAWRVALDEAIAARGKFLAYAEVRSYARSIAEVVSELESWLGESHADAVRRLAAHALEEVAAAQNEVDDSDGAIGAIVADLQDLHHEACTQVPPDPLELAAQLFDWEMDNGVGHRMALHADHTQSWASWREKAWVHIRQRIAANARSNERRRAPTTPTWGPAPSDHSLLVQTLLWEKKADETWREAAAGGCAPELWLRLAEGREASHPREAAAVYRTHIPRVLDRTSNDAYQEAIGLLDKIGKLLPKEEFSSYLNELRGAHRRKRNFIEMLNRKRW